MPFHSKTNGICHLPNKKSLFKKMKILQLTLFFKLNLGKNLIQLKNKQIRFCNSFLHQCLNEIHWILLEGRCQYSGKAAMITFQIC